MQPTRSRAADAVCAMLAIDDGRPLSRYELLKRALAVYAISIALKLDPRVFDALAAFFEWRITDNLGPRPLAKRRPPVHDVRVLRVKGSDGAFTCTRQGGWHGTV